MYFQSALELHIKTEWRHALFALQSLFVVYESNYYSNMQLEFPLLVVDQLGLSSKK